MKLSFAWWYIFCSIIFHSNHSDLICTKDTLASVSTNHKCILCGKYAHMVKWLPCRSKCIQSSKLNKLLCHTSNIHNLFLFSLHSYHPLLMAQPIIFLQEAPLLIQHSIFLVSYPNLDNFQQPFLKYRLPCLSQEYIE